MKNTIARCSILVAAALLVAVPALAADGEREVLTRGMNHVGLTVRDLDASTAFFTEVLDWEEVGGFPD